MPAIPNEVNIHQHDHNHTHVEQTTQKVTFYELSDFLEILTFNALRVGSCFLKKIITSPMFRPEYI